jgi:hypothetical protein
VCATLSTFKGGGYSTKAMLNQSKASDQWAFYQAKSIKSDLYENQKSILELESNNTSLNIDKDKLQKKIDAYDQKIAKYADDKAKIKKEAEDFEAVRDESKKHSEIFGIAVIFLQVSILLSSIAALLKKKPIWFVSIALGSVGIVYFLNGLLLFF